MPDAPDAGPEAVERFDCLRPDLAQAVGERVERFLSLPRGT